MPGVGKLSSEMDLSLWNALSCPCSRQLSLLLLRVTKLFWRLRNYKMQAEKRYSYLTFAKLLTPFTQAYVSILETTANPAKANYDLN